MEVWRREKGSTILLAILVLAVGSALVISLAQTKQNSVSSVMAQERSTRALDLAESGLETVCQQARAHIMNGKKLDNFPTSLRTGQFGGGDFTVKTELVSPERLQITSRGRYGGITRVVREVLEVIKMSNVINPGIAAGGSLTLNTANPGSYFGKRITLNGSASQLEGNPIILSVPAGGSVINNVHGPLVEIRHNVDPPPEINVDFKEIENYLKARDTSAIINSSVTWHNDIPSQYKSKPIILVKGDITINTTIELDSSITIVATGNIIINGHPSFKLKKDGLEFNLISGGNLTVNGEIRPDAEDCQSFFYAEKNMVFNGHPSINNYNCQLRAKGDMVINGKARFAHKPMVIEIPGVTVEGSGGSSGGGSNQTVFAVLNWQEIDPSEF